MKIVEFFLIIWGKWPEPEPEFLTSWSRSRSRTKMDRLRNAVSEPPFFKQMIPLLWANEPPFFVSYRYHISDHWAITSPSQWTTIFPTNEPPDVRANDPFRWPPYFQSNEPPLLRANEPPYFASQWATISSSQWATIYSSPWATIFREPMSHHIPVFEPMSHYISRATGNRPPYFRAMKHHVAKQWATTSPLLPNLLLCLFRGSNAEENALRPNSLQLEINLTLEIAQLLLSLLHAWGLDRKRKCHFYLLHTFLTHQIAGFFPLDFRRHLRSYYPQACNTGSKANF
jgi:hypothetical protein